MTEVTYHPEVRCTVLTGGLLPNGVTAQIKDVDGRSQFIQVTRGLVNKYAGVDYLAVGFVNIDRRGRRVLVEFPNEADSGANRAWVKFDDLRQESAEGKGVPA